MTDAAGRVVETYSYTAFGQAALQTEYGVALSASRVGNRYRFTGREYDAESGLYYYRVRMYNPAIGRFMQTDPVGYADGLNWYAYCGNKPIVLVDPSGSEAGWVETFSSLVVQTAKGNVGIRDVGAMYGGYLKGRFQGAAAWVDGVIPFADPLQSTYNASEMRFSQAMGGVSRNAALLATGVAAWQAAGGATMQMGASYSTRAGIHFYYGAEGTMLNSLIIEGEYTVTEIGAMYYASSGATLSGIPVWSSAAVLGTEGVTGLTCLEALLSAGINSGATAGLIAGADFVFGEPVITDAITNSNKRLK